MNFVSCSINARSRNVFDTQMCAMSLYSKRRKRRKRRKMTGPDALSFNLKRLRRMRGWSQMRLAEASGLSLTQVSSIERKLAWVSADSLKALARALEVEETALFFDPETKWTLDDLASLVSRMAKRQK